MNIEKVERIFSELREKGIKCEYDLLMHIYVILKLQNFPVLITELNALSGYSARFLYDYENPLLYNESVEYIANNLKNFLGINVRIADKDEQPFSYPFEIYPENLLVAKVKQGNVFFYRNVFVEESNLDELLDKNLHLIHIRFSKIPERKKFYNISNFIKFTEIMESEFLAQDVVLHGRKISSGKAAYEKFVRDLRNSAISFSTEGGASHPYLSYAIYPQWTAINGSISYLLGIHHFLNKKAQKEMNFAIHSMEEVLLFWREWERNVGRKAFLPPGKPISMRNRRRAANALEKAVKTYYNGIEYLKRVKELV
jgi:hypothetical protein